MRNPHQRLKWARERAGYETARDAAEALGISMTTYYGYESGLRNFTRHADKLARRLRIPVAWLMFGEGEKPAEAPEPLPIVSTSDAISIREIDVRAGAGGGGVVAQAYGFLSGGDNIDPVKDTWTIPSSFIRGQLRSRGSELDILDVLGDSMEPTLSSGDKILVDRSHRNPWPDGLFVLWDGFGVIVKRIELVRDKGDPRIRCISDNKAHSDFVLTLEEAHIIGRVVAKISTRV